MKTTWTEGNLRFEITSRPDASGAMTCYVRDPTYIEAERAIRAIPIISKTLRMEFTLVFQGDVRGVEALAREHGIQIIP